MIYNVVIDNQSLVLSIHVAVHDNHSVFWGAVFKSFFNW